MRKLLSVIVTIAALGVGAVGTVHVFANPGHTIAADSSSKSITEGNAATKDLPLQVFISPAVQAGETITVDVGCNDGTATNGVDYTCTPQQLTFSNPLDSSEDLNPVVKINGDLTFEPDETFTILLFNAKCTQTPPTGCSVSPDPADVAVTITNDDLTSRTVSISDASAAEGDDKPPPETKDVAFTATLSRPCTFDEGALTFTVTATSGTATVATDFTAPPPTVVFDIGQTSKTITAKTIGDNVFEGNESFTLTLSAPTPTGAGTCGSAVVSNFAEPPSDLKGTGTITDDDAPPGAVVKTACSGSASGDLNGDGRADLAVGIPGQGTSGKGNAGAVQVIYGGASGLQDVGKQLITQGANGVDDTGEAGDNFGQCLATGNFNGDAFDDLAIGIPFEDVTSTRGQFVDGGAVEVIYGTASGLNAGGSPTDQFWGQDSPKVPGGAEKGDGFGASLAAGDFNNDGRDDLAIGVPFEDIGNTGDAGAVNVLNGATTGLTGTGAKVWFQDVKSVAGHSEAGDLFGAALAAGDLDHNGRDDLVVGTPGEAIGAVNGAGLLQVFRAGAGGLNAALDKLWFQGSASILDTAEASDALGAAIAVADFNGDGFDDVAGGAPGEDLGSRTDVGAVSVIYGSTTGPNATNNEIWAEADGTKTTGDTANNGDRFGTSLTAGDLNGDNSADLAIGVPFNDVAGTDAGSVDVLYGATSGLANPQHFHQGNLIQASANGGAEANDAFGSALANGDYNGDGKSDLSIGVAKEDVAAIADAGAVDVVPGSSTILVLASDQYFTQDSGTVQANGSQAGDQFGASVG